MADRYRRTTIGDLRGGRNGVDPPLAIKENQCVDAVNVEWFQTTLGRKRNGMSAAAVTFSSGGPFTGKISSIFRHVPGTDETAAEQWMVDSALVTGRRAGAATLTAPTYKDALSGNGWDVDWATLNGKLFIAYPAGSSFSTPAAPVATNTGSGTYAATIRYYRIRWTQVIGGVTKQRSAVGASVSATPSGTGSAARVARPAAPGLGETNWELEVSYDNVTYRVLYGDGGLFGAPVIATTTVDDSSVSAAATTVRETLTGSATWTRPTWVTAVQYLLVAAGGAGGNNPGGGGGGGGKVKTGTFAATAATYAYVVGQGAAGAAGGDSTMFGLTAKGGGKGGDASAVGGVGGNGGGGSGSGNAGGATNDGGYAGGAGLNQGGAGAPTGGGGAGDGANGVDATTLGQNGGVGTGSSLSGAAVVYGGGGGGNAFSNASGSGGAGGGGNGGAGGNPSTGGTNGLGGGGGGGENKAGGHGTILLAYASALSILNAGLSQDTNTNRLHVWDGSTVRRTGLAVPSVPTAADTGGGAYAATIRYYRVRWAQQSGGVSVRRSEPSTSATFTPSGGGTGVVVTRPALIDEGETHWEIEGSSNNVTFYLLSTVAIATTTYTDSTAPASYSTGTNLSSLTGTFSLQKSYRFIAADQGRLIGFGSWTTAGRQNDIEISSVIGSLDVSDAERVDTTQTYRYTLDENDSGAPTGLAGPVFGNFYAFKARQTWELAPTGLTNNPYRRSPISKIVGAVQRGAYCVGEDANGNSALYFFAHRGVYVYGVGGLRYIGHGIEDYVIGQKATINLAATNVIAWMCYYPFKRQVWVGWATGRSNDPCQTAFYDVAYGGWSRVPTGDKLANIRCAALFSNTIGTAMTKDLKPYLGYALTNNKLYRGDSGTLDEATSFRAYFVTRPIEPGGPGFNGSVGDAMVLGEADKNFPINTLVFSGYGDSGSFAFYSPGGRNLGQPPANPYFGTTGSTLGMATNASPYGIFQNGFPSGYTGHGNTWAYDFTSMVTSNIAGAPLSNAGGAADNLGNSYYLQLKTAGAGAAGKTEIIIVNSSNVASVAATVNNGTNTQGWSGIGVNQDGTIAYLTEDERSGGSTLTVLKVVLSGGATSSFATGTLTLAGYWGANAGPLVLSDGSVVVPWGYRTSHLYPKRYSSAGVLLNAYQLPNIAVRLSPTGMALAYNSASDVDADAFFIGYYSDATTSSQVTVAKVKASTGEILSSFVPEDDTFAFDATFTALRTAIGTSATITAKAVPNFDQTFATTGTCDLSTSGAETRVTKRLEGSALGNVQFVQYQVGDSAATAATWALDRLVIPYAQDEGVSG